MCLGYFSAEDVLYLQVVQFSATVITCSRHI